MHLHVQHALHTHASERQRHLHAASRGDSLLVASLVVKHLAAGTRAAASLAALGPSATFLRDVAVPNPKLHSVSAMVQSPPPLPPPISFSTLRLLHLLLFLEHSLRLLPPPSLLLDA